MTAHDILVEARAAYARCGHNTPVNEWPPQGRVCAVTATDRGLRPDLGSLAYPQRDAQRTALNALRAQAKAAGYASTIEWNAYSSKAKVLAGFDRAIEATR